MTPERAQTIIKLAQARATGSPWSDQLQHVMTLAERRELLAVWKRMPGTSCFVDILMHAAKEGA